MGESSSTISLDIVKTEVSFVETDSVSGSTLNDYQPPVPSLGDIRECDDVYMKKSSTNSYLKHKMNQETSYLAVSDMSDCPIKVGNPPENNYTLALEKAMKQETLCDLTNENPGIVDSKSTSPPNYSSIDIKTGNTTHATSSHDFLKNEDSFDITPLDLVKKESSKYNLMRGEIPMYSSMLQDNTKTENSSHVSDIEQENKASDLVCEDDENVTASSSGTSSHQVTGTVKPGPDFEVSSENSSSTKTPMNVSTDLRKSEGAKNSKGSRLSNKSCNDNILFTCEICDKSFKSKHYLSTHQRVHTGEKPYTCEVCSKSFSQKSGMTAHMKIHLGIKSHFCDICSKGFTTLYSLREHISLHTGQKEFACEVPNCNKKFFTRYKLELHQRLHTGDRPHHCSVCGKNFMTPYDLKLHFKIHTEEKAHECCVCSKRFRRKTELTAHMRVHTREKPYQCSECSMTFTERGSLSHHKRIHSPAMSYICGECKKEFHHSGNLRRHMRTHTGEKPFMCEVCDRKFGTASDLKRHSEIHLDSRSKRRYVCSICEKGFLRKDHLKIHLRKIHSVEDDEEEESVEKCDSESESAQDQEDSDSSALLNVEEVMAIVSQG